MQIKNNARTSVALALVSSVIVSACGGGGDARSIPRTGVFLDAAVEGVDYVAGLAAKRTTSATGEFSCDDGNVVSFSLGGIALGTAACGASTVVTPLSLAGGTNVKADGVVNRLLLLQTLDEDDDPSNGIRITAEVATALAGKSLDVGAAPAAFTTAFSAILATLPAAYRGRSTDDLARVLAREHFENTLAVRLAAPVNEAVSQGNALGTVTATVTRYQLQAAASFYVPYEGTLPAIRSDFPNGFLPAVGSGLAFKGTLADGTLEFYAITDRGPNGDGPKVPNTGGTICFARADNTCDAKIFPAPGFAPSIGTITVGKDGAVLKSTLPLRVSSTVKVTGLPAGLNQLGASGEAPLTDALKLEPTTAATFSTNGLDTESIVVDTARNALWTSDEYGPFIVKIDPTNGTVLKKYGPAILPGSSVTAAAGITPVLPAVLAKRRANRGMEGLAIDTLTGKLHGFLQSPLTDLTPAGAPSTGTYAAPTGCSDSGTGKRVERYSAFARWVEFDPATETSRMYAYPINCADYLDNRTGNAKLGDMVAIGNGKFIVIEQGASPVTGKVFNWLMLVEIRNATDIAQPFYNPTTSDLEKSSMAGAPVNGVFDYRTTVVPLKKTKLLDLNAAGWIAEKAEGLALVNATTVALINDNDFGLRNLVFDASGAAIAGADITGCTSTNGVLSGCGTGVASRVARGLNTERPQRVWLIKFGRNVADYSVP